MMVNDQLPAFIVIGAMKAGTTTLFAQLAQHPEVFMASGKELDFFVESKNWARGIDWYHSQFDGAPDGAVIGEASPNYSKAHLFPGVPERIHGMLPDAKLVYILRDPIARAKSHYAHSIASGRERRPPRQAVAIGSDYVDTSLYGAQLTAYLRYFPAEQILVVTTENLRDDPNALMNSICAFLGVHNTTLVDPDLRANQTANKRAYGAIGGALRRHKGLLRAAGKVVPHGAYSFFRDRLSHDIRLGEMAVPDDVIAAITPALAADRRLLTSLCDVDISGWAPVADWTV